MAVGGGAVAVGAYWEIVDVVDCAVLSICDWQSAGVQLTERATLSRQARDADVEVDALTGGVGTRNNRTSDRVVLREGGDVLHTRRIVGGDGSGVGEDGRK